MSNEFDGLTRLAERVAQDLSWLGRPNEPWIPATLDESGYEVLDVAIIGGGMSGLGAAAALLLNGVTRTAVFDRSPVGKEGPWSTFARMTTLRTPKEAIGPSPGIPSATPRAWYEARFGGRAWNLLTHFPLNDWADYLKWFRQIMQIPVRNDCNVVEILPLASGRLLLTIESPEGRQQVQARRVVVATGFGGMGGPKIPKAVLNVPEHLWSHSAQAIDWSRLVGKRVGVLGVGASAVDNAATALESGAASVDFLVRRDEVPAIQRARAIMNPGSFEGFGSLPMETRLALWKLLGGNPPPRHSLLRLNRDGRYRLHVGAENVSFQWNGTSLQVRAGDAHLELDHLICATGFEVDTDLRPEWSRLTNRLKFIGDDPALASVPVVDDEYRLVERVPSACPAVRNIFCIADAAVPSQGIAPVSVTGLETVVRRMTSALMASIFAEDSELFQYRMANYGEREFEPEEWQPELAERGSSI